MTTDDSSSSKHDDSPGNAYKLNASTPSTRWPGMNFIWRLECEIAPTEVEVGAPHGAGITQSIVDILDGKVKGPEIE